MESPSTLSSTTVSALLPVEKEIIAFYPSLTFGDALELMSHYEIFAAPIVNAAGQCVGHVDYLDLLCKLVELSNQESDSAVWPPTRNLRGDDIDTMMRRANDWTLEELVKAGKIKVSRRDPFFFVSTLSSLMDAVGFFGRGVHHLLVVEGESGKVANLLSQTDLIRFVAKDISQLGALASKKLRELGLGTRSLFVVRNTDSALDSFYELYQEGVSGGAIINAEGKLVGNFSRYDLKGTQGGTGFKVLSQSIMHYQRKHRVALAQRLVTVNLDMQFSDVVATMAREKVHRVFVVEGGMFPKGTITQTDICRVIHEHLIGGAHKTPTKEEVKTQMKTHQERPLEFPLVFPPQ